MLIHTPTVVSHKRKHIRRGQGLVNTLIDKLPFELHIPGYNYCGPGTKLSKRLARGDPGINKLDQSCLEHDRKYSESKDIEKRHQADKVLAEKAWERVKSKDASVGERLAALGVTGIMKAKTKLGMGLRKRNKLKKGRGMKKQKKRIIKTPKRIGGFLPLLFPLLGALGALGGGAAGIAKAVNDAKANKQLLEETQRHNKAMEAKGKGLYLKPYRGRGLYLAPYKKKFQ